MNHRRGYINTTVYTNYTRQITPVMSAETFRRWYNNPKVDADAEWGVRHCNICDKLFVCSHLYAEARKKHPDWPENIKSFRCTDCNCCATEIHSAFCSGRLGTGPEWKVE